MTNINSSGGPNISVCFSTTNHLVSRVIRFVTRSEVSHALLTYQDETLGKVMVLEAVGVGFRMVPWTKWRQGNTLVARFGVVRGAPGEAISQEVQVRALQALAGLLGEEYDTLGALGYVFKRLFKYAFKKLRNPFQSPHKLFCSEAVALFLRYLKLLPEKLDPAFQSPGDLLSLCWDISKSSGYLTCLERG